MIKFVVGFVALLCIAQGAAGQAYPNKPVRLILGASAGGGSDVIARSISQKFLEVTGQPLVIEYKAGADEQIASAALVAAPPDGYTILLVGPSFAINPALYTKLPYDSARDFAPITMLATAPFALLVNPELPVHDVKELVTLAKQKAGALNYATLGPGSPQGLAMEWFKRLAGVDIVAIQYKGVGPAMLAGMSGEVQALVAGLTAGLAQVKAGKLRAIAVTSAKRTSVAPEIPTVAESGFPGFDLFTWYGILAPAGTPASVVEKLNSDLNAVLLSKEVRERLLASGVESSPMTPAAFTTFIKDNAALWRQIITDAGVPKQ
jgi:tripartite-type tricarboxylate transporter receptor subunit TctC